MTNVEAKELRLGLHRLFWKSGGFSLAAVGVLHDGRRWFAPVNWTAKDRFDASTDWRRVARVEYIDAGKTNEEFPEPVLKEAKPSWKDSGIGKVAAFDAAEAAIYEAFRWFCCDSNADQKGCDESCPRKCALDSMSRGRALLLLSEWAR